VATVKGEPVNLQPSMGGWKPSTANMPQQKPKFAGVPASAKGKGKLVTLHESPTPCMGMISNLGC